MLVHIVRLMFLLLVLKYHVLVSNEKEHYYVTIYTVVLTQRAYLENIWNNNLMRLEVS